MSGRTGYKRKVINMDGRILEYPMVGDDGILDSHAVLDPYSISSKQLYPLGTKLIEGERMWRYCKNGAGTPGPGTLLQACVVHHAANDLDLVTDATTPIGAYTISLTSTASAAVAVDYYKEGYAFVNAGGGFGSVYKIKEHDALVGTTAGSIFTLYDPLVVASTAASSLWGLRKNLYDSVLATAAPVTGKVIGVNMLTLVASNYFWAQTAGPAAVLTHAAIAANKYAIAGTTAAQADPSVTDVSAKHAVGYPISVCDTGGEASLIYLTLES